MWRSSIPVLLFIGTAACSSDVQDGGDGGSGGSTSSFPANTSGEGGQADGVGGSPDTSTTGQGGGGAGPGSGGGVDNACPNDPPYTPTLPKGRPPGAAPGDGGGVVLGVSRWYLGDTDRDGTSLPTAWEGFGFDLDVVNTADGDGNGQVNGDDLVCVCAPVGGEVNAGNLEDGPGGLDNSWAKNTLSFLGSIFEDPSAMATEAVEEGYGTVAFALGTVGASNDADPVPTSYYVLRNGETGVWEIAPEQLNGGDPANPQVVLAAAYVTGGTFVAVDIPLLTLPIVFGGLPLTLQLHDATISMDLSADRTSASGGVIAGTLDTEELIVAFGEAASAIGGGTEGLCPGDQLFESIVQNIRSASDIGRDGTQHVGAPCDGLSFAVGFEANEVVLGDVAEPLEPPGPCGE